MKKNKTAYLIFTFILFSFSSYSQHIKHNGIDIYSEMSDNLVNDAHEVNRLEAGQICSYQRSVVSVDSSSIIGIFSPEPPFDSRIVQSFIGPEELVSAIVVGLNNSPHTDYFLTLHDGPVPPDGTPPSLPIATATCNVELNYSGDLLFQFNTELQLVQGQEYYFMWSWSTNEVNYFFHFNSLTTGDAYPEGKFYLFRNDPNDPMNTYEWDDLSELPEVYQGDIYFQVINCPSPIPTLSQWGIIALGMIFLIFGLVVIRQRKVILGKI